MLDVLEKDFPRSVRPKQLRALALARRAQQCLIWFYPVEASRRISTVSSMVLASQKPYRNAAPIMLQVAPTMTAGTRPHSFAVPPQLFADDNLLQPCENWLCVREL